MKFTIEENKKLVERYPYLMPRNVWTGKVPENYDYSFINGVGEVPDGWTKLFLQMCEDIRQPLIDAGYLEKFRFSQIKEKYGKMCCYNFGAPDTVHNIIMKYEVMSQAVCARCGRPAVYETQGWIEPLCVECWKDYVRHGDVEKIDFKPCFKITRYSNGEKLEEIVSFEEEWNRYIKENGYDKI